MNWLLIAIVGHVSNGIAFAIDKSLLRSAFSRSATYAGLVGGLSCLALFATPWVKTWPQGVDLLYGLIGGMTFVFALWAFFAALSRGEASRIVPIVGSLIPILTVIQAYTFLNERLDARIMVGIGLLVCATILFTFGGSSGRLSTKAILLAVLSALLFAISSISTKAVYDVVGFLGGFITTRIAATIAAIMILVVFDSVAGQEVRNMFRRTSKKKKQHSSVALALCGQSLGAIGFMCVQWSMSQGSPSIVNALQAVQYAFLVFIAVALRTQAKKILGEELTRESLFVKAIALGITAIGMYLII